MIKVFLVEDEIVMREGIKNTISWEKEGFQFVGEASDGELAYPLIQKTRPDILITDIKMPFMDGLELSRLVKKELPDVKIIILSGYDEFKYAQEGINIGIADYLLKPVTGARLLAAIKKVAEEVRKEREQKSFRETFDQEQEERLQMEKQKYFRRMISGQMSVSVMLSEGAALGLDMAAEAYNILLFQVFAGENQEEYSETANRITEEIREMAARQEQAVLIEMSTQGLAFLIRGTCGHTVQEVLEGLIRELLKILERYPEVSYFGGVGSTVSRLSELSRCSEEANRAFAYRYIRKRNQIVRSEDQEGENSQEELKLSTLNVNQIDRKIADNFLRTGLKGETRHFLEEYIDSLGRDNMASLMFRQYITMDLYITAVGVLEQLGYGSSELVERCGDFQQMAGVFESAKQMGEYLEKVFETVIELRERAASKRYSSLLEKAVAYIQENFCSPDISLNSVAASVNLSPNHFSTVFSQEMGQTFVEYLTAQRMGKARELLRGTNMKTAEIAYAVGYKDPHYFSYLFKKTQNCTPREFKGKA